MQKIYTLILTSILSVLLLCSGAQNMTASRITKKIFPGLNVSSQTHYKNPALFKQKREFAKKTILYKRLHPSKTHAPAAVITSIANGNWSNPATWDSNTVPTATDDVIIDATHTVTIDATANVNNLEVDGNLVFSSTAGQTININGDTYIETTGSFSSAATGTIKTHVLNVLGEFFQNEGILDLSTNANTAGATFKFSNTAGLQYLFGAGPVNDFYIMLTNMVDYSSIAYTWVDFFTVRGQDTNATGALFTSGQGIGCVWFYGTYTFSGTLWSTAAYNCPLDMGIILENPNFTVNGMNGTCTVPGTIAVIDGTYNVGTASGNSMNLGVEGWLEVDGGAVNAAGRLSVASAANLIYYFQTGGTITVCTKGNTSTSLASLDLGTSIDSYTDIEAGDVIVQLANTAASGPGDYRNDAGEGPSTVIGGTLQLGNSLSGAAKAFRIGSVIPNLVIDNSSAAHTATFTIQPNYYNCILDIYLTTGTKLTVANDYNFLGGTTVVNDGTITANGTSSYLYLSGAAPDYYPSELYYAGTGICTAPVNALIIDNGVGIQFDPSVTNVPCLRVILFTGGITNANKITLGNGGTTTATVQIGNTTTPTDAGYFDLAPAFNLGTGGQVISYLRVVNARSTGPEITPTRLLTNLTVDDDVNTLTLADGNLSVGSGTLALTNANFNLGGNTLTLGTSTTVRGTLTYANNSVLFNGYFKRWLTNTTGSTPFPVGDDGIRRLANINYTGAPTAGGTLTAGWINLPEWTNGLPLTQGAITIDRTAGEGYWSVVAANGLTGGTYTGTFTGTGISGIGDYTKLVLLKRTNSSSPWTLNGTHVTTTGSNAAPVLSRTGMTGFSEFGIGGQNPVNPLPVTLEFFKGNKHGSVHELGWKANCLSTSIKFEVLRSNNASAEFISLGSITADKARCAQPFDYNDFRPLAGMNFYRLKMTEADGKVTYSQIIAVLNKEAGFEVVNLAPSVTANATTLNVTSATAAAIQLIITDISGQQVQKQMVNLTSGSNAINVNVNTLAKGTYNLSVVTAEGVVKTLRFIKQ